MKWRSLQMMESRYHASTQRTNGGPDSFSYLSVSGTLHTKRLQWCIYISLSRLCYALYFSLVYMHKHPVQIQHVSAPKLFLSVRKLNEWYSGDNIRISSLDWGDSWGAWNWSWEWFIHQRRSRKCTHTEAWSLTLCLTEGIGIHSENPRG